jgi:hypothetical protein
MDPLTWIHKWHDSLEKQVDHGGNIDDQSEAQTLRVMVLQDIQHLVRLSDFGSRKGY